MDQRRRTWRCTLPSHHWAGRSWGPGRGSSAPSRPPTAQRSGSPWSAPNPTANTRGPFGRDAVLGVSPARVACPCRVPRTAVRGRVRDASALLTARPTATGTRTRLLRGGTIAETGGEEAVPEPEVAWPGHRGSA